MKFASFKEMHLQGLNYNFKLDFIDEFYVMQRGRYCPKNWYSFFNNFGKRIRRRMFIEETGNIFGQDKFL